MILGLGCQDCGPTFHVIMIMVKGTSNIPANSFVLGPYLGLTLKVGVICVVSFFNRYLCEFFFALSDICAFLGSIWCDVSRIGCF